MGNDVKLDIEARFEHARDVIRDAGKRAMKYYDGTAGDLEIEAKENALDMVSIADKNVEAIIRDRIADSFPEDGFLGEEMGIEKGDNDCLWVIDPIDGTACFVNQMPSWCISLALVVDNEIVLGLIYHPCGDELFTARLGEGAFANGEPIKASSAKTVGDGLLGLGMSHRTKSDEITGFIKELLDREGIFVRNGSGALMMAYAAAGRLIGYYEPHINPWDCMAGIILMREAGGWANDYLGVPDVLENGAPILTAGPDVAEELKTMSGVTQ
ncbi:inositol monophosphatase family protein [Thalassospira australica]|uniref:inositol monophosphatase family protein n=1 Tax=Thalassospira australica TaxID=1528106 RepID=UPI00051A25DB|nr:inositol monophosphatase [Thalassospira australica]